MGDRLIRIGLVYLAIGAASVGLWALPAPRSWFDSFPGGLFDPWVRALPPYNEHLAREVGALYLGFAVLFAWAALRPSRALIVPLAVAWIVAQVPHLVFHLKERGGLDTFDYVSQSGALVGFVVVAAALAFFSEPRGSRGP